MSPAVGRCVDVALEVPLAQLGRGRLGQRDDARTARVEVLDEPLDRAALAGRVATLEDDHVLAPESWAQYWNFSSSICSRYFSTS